MFTSVVYAIQEVHRSTIDLIAERVRLEETCVNGKTVFPIDDWVKILEFDDLTERFRIASHNLCK